MDVFVNENEELIKQVQLLRLCRKVQLWQSHSAASTAWSAAFRASSKVNVVFAYEN